MLISVENNVGRNVLEALVKDASVHTILVSFLKKTHGENDIVSVTDVKSMLNTIREQFFELLENQFMSDLERKFQYKEYSSLTWQDIKKRFSRYDEILETSKHFFEFQSMQIVKWVEYQAAEKANFTIHDLENKLPDMKIKPNDNEGLSNKNEEAIRISNMVLSMMSIVSDTLN